MCAFSLHEVPFFISYSCRELYELLDFISKIHEWHEKVHEVRTSVRHNHDIKSFLRRVHCTGTHDTGSMQKFMGGSIRQWNGTFTFNEQAI